MTLEHLYSQNYDTLINHLTRRGLSTSDAQDIIQTVFCDFLQSQLDLSTLDNPPAFLQQSCKFKTLAKRRNELFRSSCVLRLPIAYLPKQESWLLSSSIFHYICSWKSGTTKDVTLLKLFLDAKLVEIQSALGLTQTTTQMAWFRGQRKLRKWLGKVTHK